jgi:vacuolar-type H+-ATPase subunit I/STV1
MSDNPVQPMSIADATNAVGQLVNIFKGLRRFDELLATCSTLDQLTAEKQAAAEAARRDAETEGQVAEEARLRAARMSDECTSRMDAAKAEAERVEQECRDRATAARTDAARTVAQEQAATDQAVREFAGMIDAKRAELAEVTTQLEETRSALAALKAKFG